MNMSAPDRDTKGRASRRAGGGLAVVVPCFRERDAILDVLAGIGPEVDRIYVVDDACPDGTGSHVADAVADERVTVLTHGANQGVGAATLTGIAAALDNGAEVIVKLDGDGQMDPALIPEIAGPVLRGEADYAKGNRFHELSSLREMPMHRLIGNVALSFVSKASSGYWNLFDPTNGFVAIHADVARRLPFERISRSYFFESDMLHQLYLLRAVVADVPMAARYEGTRESHLRVGSVSLEFAAKHCRNLVRRLFYTYFLRDFTMASVELALGLPLLAFGVIFGAWVWSANAAAGVATPAGTVMLAALPVIVGIQFLLAFLQFDMANMPSKPLRR